MDISKVTVTYGRKLNLGDYNQAHLEMTVEGVIDPREEPEDIQADMENLWALAKASVKEQAMPLLKEQKPTVVVNTPPVPTGATPPPPPPKPVEAHIVLADPAIAHIITGGNSEALKVFGKTEGYNLEKWGVYMWEEIADLYEEMAGWRDWSVCASSKAGFEESNRFRLPDPYTEAVISLKEKDGKIVPDKVISLR